MCGIVGIAGTRDVAPIILEALKRLAAGEGPYSTNASTSGIDGSQIALDLLSSMRIWDSPAH